MFIIDKLEVEDGQALKPSFNLAWFMWMAGSAWPFKQRPSDSNLIYLEIPG